MKYIYYLFKSIYCKITFIIALIISYLLLPKSIFYSWYILLGITFMISFSLTISCIVRNIKEKIKLAKTYKSSIIGLISTIIGLSALQVCGIGAPICGATIGFGFLATIFPSLFLNMSNSFAIFLVIFSIILQIVALYFMNCFKKVKI